MTTIAYKDGILAADTQLTEDNLKSFCRKIDVLPEGTVVASCGGLTDQTVFLEWLANPKKKKPPTTFHKGFELILIDPDRDAVYYDPHCIPHKINDPIWSTGSGWKIARAAMMLGLSAKESVEFAGDIDVCTNKLVDTYDTKTKKLTLARFPRIK